MYYVPTIMYIIVVFSCVLESNASDIIAKVSGGPIDDVQARLDSCRFDRLWKQPAKVHIS
jgi:hypothetical protein